LIALDLVEMLTRLGHVVIGPASTVTKALELLEIEEPDLAVLDVNVRRERVTPVADALRERGTPFALATAYDRSQLPEKSLREAPLLQKPVNPSLLYDTLADLAESRSGASACIDTVTSGSVRWHDEPVLRSPECAGAGRIAAE
jgi:two-component system, response regulator PdtaR